MGVRGGRGVERVQNSFVGHQLQAERMQNPTPEEVLVKADVAMARQTIEDMRAQIVMGVRYGLRSTGYEKLMAVSIVDEVVGKLRLEEINKDRNFERLKIQNNVGI